MSYVFIRFFSLIAVFAGAIDTYCCTKKPEIEQYSDFSVSPLAHYPHSVKSMSMSFDGKVLLTLLVSGVSSFLSLRAAEAAEGESCSIDDCLTTEGAHVIEVAALHSTGDYAVIGVEDCKERVHALYVVDRKSGKVEAKKDFQRPLCCLALHPSSESALVGLDDGSVYFEHFTKKELSKYLGKESGSISSLTFSPDGTMALAGSLDATACLWNVASGRLIKELKGHKDSVCAVAFSSDGKSIFTGSSDTTIRLWDSFTGRCYKELQGHKGSISCLTLNADGTVLVATSTDGSVSFFTAKTGELRGALKVDEGYVKALICSKEDTLFMGSSTGKVCCLDISYFSNQKSEGTSQEEALEGDSLGEDSEGLLTDIDSSTESTGEEETLVTSGKDQPQQLPIFFMRKWAYTEAILDDSSQIDLCSVQ